MEGPPGSESGGGAVRDRRATLRTVAERAGVHISTASRALNPNESQRLRAGTVKKVRDAAKELGYSPDPVATGLKSGRTMSVGMIVADLVNPYNAPLVRGLSRTMEEHGLVTLVAETVENPARLERLFDYFLQRRVDAIVTAAARLGDERKIRSLIGSTPLVLAVRDLPGSGWSAVVHNDHAGGEIAAQHLLELGHRDVAQLLGPQDIDTFVRRAEGFGGAVGAAGATDLSLDVAMAAPNQGEGRRLMSLLLSAERRPTAVFAPSDVTAVGAIDAVTRAGLRCPEDVSVVGYNDVPLSANLTPSLTTVRLPSEELGRIAGRLALELIADNDAVERRVELPAMLVRRDSTGPRSAPRSVA